MMLRLLMFYVPCLLLFCCNKQGSVSVKDREQTGEVSKPRQKYSDRERTDHKPANHRTPLEKLDRIESSAMREKALSEFAWNAIETDPALAQEAFQRLTAGSSEKIRLIEHYALRLAEQNIEEALLWSDGLSTEQEKAVAKYNIALVIAKTDPLLAASMLSECGIAGRDFDVAAVHVIRSWASSSAPDAVAWVSMFPPGPSREAGFQAIAQQWLISDPGAVFSWLESTTDNTLRHETSKAIAGAIDQQPPPIQEDWLKQASPSVRNELQIPRE
jgi:hypothetical protein